MGKPPPFTVDPKISLEIL